MAIDSTVKVFNNFYNLDLVVNANDYEIVYSFFKEYTSNETTAKAFTETLFRVSNVTQLPVLELLDTFQNGSTMQVNATMAYYLNSLGNKTVLYGVVDRITPNESVQRNIVQ